MISPMEINEQFKLWFYCIYFFKFEIHGSFFTVSKF